MKKILFLLLFVFLLVDISVFSQIIEKTYSFNQFQIKEIGNYQVFLLENTNQIGKAGEPVLPYMAVKLMLPAGTVAETIEITGYDEVIIDKNINLLPKQYSYPLSTNKAKQFVKNMAIYNADENYPAKQYGNLTTQFLNGYSFALSSFTPVKYNPVSGKLSYYKSVTVKINLKTDSKASNALTMIKSSKTVKNKVMAFAQNSEMINSYPKSEKSLNDYQLLIITSEEFAEAFDTLKTIYNQRGINTQIISVENINSTVSGADLQEKIRNYIIEQYQQYNCEYVLLGGDVEIIPYRGFYCTVQSSSVYEDENIPSDLYYSSLDGTWNSNGNELWGEIGEDDLLPEIAVARFSVSNLSELQNMLNKDISYQNNPVLGELNKPLLVGEHLWDDPLTWGGDYLDLIVGHHEDNGYTTDGIPATDNYETLYDRNIGTWTKETLLTKINQGHSFIHHVGHANSNYNMRMYDSDITNSNFSQVNGTTHNFTFVYTHGCISGSFDVNDCIGEVMTNIQNFAVAFIGNSRYGWFNEGQTEGPSEHIHREFIDALYGQKESHLGQAHLLSKLNTAPWVNADGQHEDGALRWCFYDCNVLGDPALSIWTNEPVSVVANFDDSLELGTQSFDIHVLDGTTPMANMNCVFVLNNESYGKATTDSNGNATLNIDKYLSIIGEGELLISGYNCNPVSFPVYISTPDDAPFIALSNLEIIDNENSEADYNENISLNISLENLGLQQGSNITAYISGDDEYVSYGDNLAVFGSINPNQLSTLTNAFVLNIANYVPDQHNAELYMIVSADGDYEWAIPFEITINAPVLSLGNMFVDDTQGNNNGVIDTGEIINLSFLISNNGHANSPVLTSVLTCRNSHISVTSPEQELQSCESNGMLFTNYEITVDNDLTVGTNIIFDLTVTGNDYNAQKLYNTTSGIQMDGFESGDFTLFEWNSDGTSPWIVTNDYYEGDYAAKSGVIYDDESSSLLLNIDVATNGEISFWKKVSSESSFDYLRFYIDDSPVSAWSGEEDWSNESFYIGAGTHILKWSYEKDGSLSSGEDCAWIDNVILPPLVTVQPVFSINIDSVIYSMPLFKIDTIPFTISNTGEGNLLYSIGFDTEEDWLRVDNSNGVLTGGSQKELNLIFKSNGLTEGNYNCNMIINEIGTTTIPVSLSVVSNSVKQMSNNIFKFQIFPNPIKTNAVISFNLIKKSPVKIELFNQEGRLVKLLLNNNITNGNFNTTITSNNLKSGIYLLKLTVNGYSVFKKIVIL